MKTNKTAPLFLVSASLAATVLSVSQNAFAQGISEYGSLMAMPKPMGSAHTMGGSMNKLYGAPTKALQGLGSSGQTGGRPSPSARSTNLGTPVAITKSATGSSTASSKTEVLKLSAQAKQYLQQAQTFFKAEKWDEAEVAYKKSLGIRETYWKDRDPAIPDILNALAEISIAKENPEACRKYLNASLVVLGKLYGPGTAHHIKPLALQGSLYEAQNDPGRALDSYQQCKLLADRLTAEEKTKFVNPELADKINQKCVELLAKVTGKPAEASQSEKTSENLSK
ncbi:MAG: tetratricopeptide repeat protein [Candidatus Melainabacteria bacterium]|nr:tetratricopeptide repeat protein [Candidatus Melainabacteria bacterium]